MNSKLPLLHYVWFVALKMRYLAKSSILYFQLPAAINENYSTTTLEAKVYIKKLVLLIRHPSASF
jgi:hypothetical protein